MLSPTSSGRMRPKSPLSTQPPARKPAANSTANEVAGRRWPRDLNSERSRRIMEKTSGAGLAARSPAAPAAALAAARRALGRRVVAVTFDTNHRQDDHGRRLGTHPDHPAVARTAPVLGKFHHGPHYEVPHRALLARPFADDQLETSQG